jgi:hypothetical protein
VSHYHLNVAAFKCQQVRLLLQILPCAEMLQPILHLKQSVFKNVNYFFAQKRGRLLELKVFAALVALYPILLLLILQLQRQRCIT